MKFTRKNKAFIVLLGLSIGLNIYFLFFNTEPKYERSYLAASQVLASEVGHIYLNRQSDLLKLFMEEEDMNESVRFSLKIMADLQRRYIMYYAGENANWELSNALDILSATQVSLYDRLNFENRQVIMEITSRISDFSSLLFQFSEEEFTEEHIIEIITQVEEMAERFEELQ